MYISHNIIGTFEKIPSCNAYHTVPYFIAVVNIYWAMHVSLDINTVHLDLDESNINFLRSGRKF